MSVLIFGLATIASVFVAWTFFFLSLSGVREPKWASKAYFWLVTGSFWVSVGLLWFFAVRTWQAVSLPVIPFVQSPFAALAASTVILVGLAFKVRAISLNNSRAGWWFVGLSAAWAVFSLVRN